MFGFGKQKKDAYQGTHQEDYYYDDYEDGYEEDYGYDTYPDEGYERQGEAYNDYERSDPRAPRRTEAPTEERYDGHYAEESDSAPIQRSESDSRMRRESALQQDVERLEETVGQLKHQLEVKQTEMGTLATTLTEKDQALQEQQAHAAQQMQELEEEKKQALLELATEKEAHIRELNEQLDQLKRDLDESQTTQAEALNQAYRQIDELKQTQKENDEMKIELTTILIETKNQERAILERAEYEAKGIRSQAEQEAQQVIHDASLELRVMKQEIKNYRKRLRSVQEETTQFFVRLLANSDALLDEE